MIFPVEAVEYGIAARGPSGPLLHTCDPLSSRWQSPPSWRLARPHCQTAKSFSVGVSAYTVTAAAVRFVTTTVAIRKL